MSDMPPQRSLSVGAFALVAGATGLATWLCIGWFGAQGPLAAAVGVMLVELFLACVGIIVVQLAACLMDAYLLGEARFPEQPVPSQDLWLWRPLWLPHSRWNPQSDESPPRHTALALTPVGHWLRCVHDELQPLDELVESDDGDELPVTPSDELPVTLRFPIVVGEQVAGDGESRDVLSHRRVA